MNEPSTKELQEQITKLTCEWYDIIKTDHHKDRDCHWNISVRWSYGDEPAFVIEHHGYILDHIEQSYPSYRSACFGLISMLEKFIREEVEEQKKQ
jgi:hypothetical protein